MIIIKVNLYTASKYLKYKLFSSHGKGHGIHSPFVYHLVKNVFRNKISPEIVLKIEGIRKKIAGDFRKIEVTDLGSGSKHIKGSLRKISDISKHSAVPKKYGILLASLAREFGQDGIIELGTSLGISSMYLASGCSSATLHTIEGCSSTSSAAKEFISYSGLENIEFYNGDFDTMLELIGKKGITPGLVFLDGDHRKESVKRYFSAICEFSGNNTVIVIDDIHSSAEMEGAWEWILKDERVSLTIDIFRMGLIFFRKGVTRCDYVIRY